MLINTVRQLFPEFEQVFKDVSGVTAAAVIRAGLEPHVICTHSENTFVASVRSHLEGQRLSVSQVRRLYGLASQSVGYSQATQTLRLLAQQHIQALHWLDGQAEQLLTDLLTLFHSLPEAPYTGTARTHCGASVCSQLRA